MEPFWIPELLPWNTRSVCVSFRCVVLVESISHGLFFENTQNTTFSNRCNFIKSYSFFDQEPSLEIPRRVLDKFWGKKIELIFICFYENQQKWKIACRLRTTPDQQNVFVLGATFSGNDCPGSSAFKQKKNCSKRVFLCKVTLLKIGWFSKKRPYEIDSTNNTCLIS